MAPLEKRLTKLFEWCQSYQVVADIGSGQGRLARALARHGHHVFATEKTLVGWQELVQYTRNFDNIVPLRGDGLEPLSALDIAMDIIVVAGMGPKTIEHILRQNAPSRRILTFIVQPMQGLFVLRRYLQAESWFVRRAELVQERGRLYGMWWIEKNRNESVSPLSEWLPTEFLGSSLYPLLIQDRLAQLDWKLQHQNRTNRMFCEWQDERNSLLSMLR